MTLKILQGAHFSKDTVNRPGFADLFFSSATEEREHASKLLEYLLMRGELTEGIDRIIVNVVSYYTFDFTNFRLNQLFLQTPLKEYWSSAVNALKDALELEAHVTRKIRAMIKACEGGTNDFHVNQSLILRFHQMLIFWLKLAVRRLFDGRIPGGATQGLPRPRRKVVHAGQDDEEQWTAGRVPLRQEAARWRRLILDIMSSLTTRPGLAIGLTGLKPGAPQEI